MRLCWHIENCLKKHNSTECVKVKTWPVESRSHLVAVRRQLREKWTLFSRVGFYIVNKLMLTTLFFFLASPVPVSWVPKTNDEGRRGGVGGREAVTTKQLLLLQKSENQHGQKGWILCCFERCQWSALIKRSETETCQSRTRDWNEHLLHTKFFIYSSHLVLRK